MMLIHYLLCDTNHHLLLLTCPSGSQVVTSQSQLAVVQIVKSAVTDKLEIGSRHSGSVRRVRLLCVSIPALSVITA